MARMTRPKHRGSVRAYFWPFSEHRLFDTRPKGLRDGSRWRHSQHKLCERRTQNNSTPLFALVALWQKDSEGGIPLYGVDRRGNWKKCLGCGVRIVLQVSCTI
jgi:hypothetical protein